MSIYSVNILSVCLSVILQKALLLMDVFILVLLDDCNLVFCFRAKVVILFPLGITMKGNGIRYLLLSRIFIVFIMVQLSNSTLHQQPAYTMYITISLISYFKIAVGHKIFVEKIGFVAYFRFG